MADADSGILCREGFVSNLRQIECGGGHIQHSESTNFSKITTGMPLGGTNLSAVSVNDEWIVYGIIDNGIWYQPLSVITGINDGPIDYEGFNCFPNPTRGKFQIPNCRQFPK